MIATLYRERQAALAGLAASAPPLDLSIEPRGQEFRNLVGDLHVLIANLDPYIAAIARHAAQHSDAITPRSHQNVLREALEDLRMQIEEAAEEADGPAPALYDRMLVSERL